MPDTSRMIPLVSAATLALVIGQGASAQPQATATAQAAPTSEPAAAAAPAAAQTEAPAPAAAQTIAPTSAEIARGKAEERRAAMTAEREKRYEELRAHAAEIGLELPETPPWETAMPEPPAMPERRGMSPEDMEAMREQRRAMREKMRSMTPEERRAMRDAHWEQMRADAAERGVEMPETPPWVEAEQRRKEMDQRFEKYRKTVEAMSEEQIEAARAIFGNAPPTPEVPAMPHRMPPYGYGSGYGQGYGPQGGYPGAMPYPGEPGGMGDGPMMPYYGAPDFDRGPPPPRGSGN